MQARLFTHPAAARQRFLELSQRPEPLLDLVEASLVIALEEYPGLDIDGYLSRVDGWSDAIRERMEGSRDIERIVEEINRLLFEEEGFHGEAGNYYDPRNTFLNEVLDRHAGLPLALSIVYLEISRRLGVDMSGVALPGRFLVKVCGEWGTIFIDPFDEGRVLTTAECQKIMDEVYGGGVRLREHHLRSSTRREIVGRVLSHLKSIYLSSNDLSRAIGSVDRLLILDGKDSYELRDRGLVSMQLHRYDEAIEFLERYLAATPHADDRPRIREQIEYLKAWMERN